MNAWGEHKRLRILDCCDFDDSKDRTSSIVSSQIDLNKAKINDLRSDFIFQIIQTVKCLHLQDGDVAFDNNLNHLV
jgi:hypothetical protein